MNDSSCQTNRSGSRHLIQIPDRYEKLVAASLDACFRVHRELGPGLLEGLYEGCLYWELRDMGLSVSRQVPISLTYRGRTMETAFRADLIVEDGNGGRVLIELKAVAEMAPIFQAQIISYLRILNLPLGLLVNFNNCLLKDGISRILNRGWTSEKPNT